MRNNRKGCINTSVLQIFEKVTVELSANKTVSVSKIIVLVSSMLYTIKTFVHDISLLYGVNQMVVSLKVELNRRFKGIENDELIFHATILDPGFK